MRKERLFAITEFAKVARTTRHTLIHYDEIDLLSPAMRGGNNYRYYSHNQLAAVNLIHTCQELGMSLDAIKDLTSQRTPESMDKLLDHQIKCVKGKIHGWNRALKLLSTLKSTIHSALDVDENAITVQYLEAQPIILGEPNDYRYGRDDYDALFSFYRSFIDKGTDIDVNYPVWGMFSEERIKLRDWRWPDRYYFFNPDGHDRRPAAFYAVGYKRGGYGQSTGLYLRLLDYIDANGYEICGPAYEEYPLNEICVSDENNYLMRVMITVQKKT